MTITNSQIREGLRERELAASKLIELGYEYGPAPFNPHVKAWVLKTTRPQWQTDLLKQMEESFRVNVLEPALVAEASKVALEKDIDRTGSSFRIPMETIRLLPVGHFLKDTRFTGKTFRVHTVEDVRPMHQDAKRLGFSGTLVGFAVTPILGESIKKEVWLPINMVTFIQ